MASFGRQPLTNTGYPVEVSADGKPEWKTGGITLDWGTVIAAAVDTVLGDQSTIKAGYRGLEYGTVLAKITASGKYGPFTPVMSATTTSASSAIGATQLSLTSGANINPGDTLSIDVSGQLETAVVLSVSGTTVTFTTALTKTHASGVAVSKPDDGRQTLARGNCAILNETILELGPVPGLTAPPSDHPGVLEGGRVWKARLKIGGTGQPTQTQFEAAFPRISYVQ